MWKRTDGPAPADVWRLIFKLCARKCGSCMECQRFTQMGPALEPNEALSALRRHREAERVKFAE